MIRDKNDFWLYFVALMIGLFGMMLYLSAYHLYLDHKFVDAIREQIQQQQQNRSTQPNQQPERK